MKKILSQISLILGIMIVLATSVLITDVKAESVAGINCPSSVNLNSNFNVALILPSNAYAAEATVTVKFSDGTTTSGKIVYVSGMNDFPNSVSLTAKVAGTATVTVSNITISDVNSSAIETGGSKSQTLTVVNPNATTSSSSSETTSSGTTSSSTSTDSSSSSSSSSNSTTTNVKFTDTNETVYTTDSCNVRESYSTSSNKVTKLAKGTAVKRTGVGDNGWSRVEYNGKTCYISSQFLTTEKPADPEFTETNQTMYALQSCNVRKSWSTSSDKIGYLNKSQEVTVIGVNTEIGWTKIKYNGQDAYVSSKLLSSEVPDETEDPSDDTENTVTDETVETEEKDELTLIQEEIGVLPEVGKNIATIFYVVITIMALVTVLGGYYFINKKTNN